MYALAIQFTETDFKVSIDGEVKLAITQDEAVARCQAHAALNATAMENCKTSTGKAWRKGRIAWYNHSQHGVTYGNIRLFHITAGQSDAPKAGPDIFGVSRVNGLLTKPVMMDFYVGLLANDWSPKLLNMEAIIANFGEDPMTNPAPGGVATCEYGSKITVYANGTFLYVPDADLTRKADVDGVSAENCMYRVKDSIGQWSDLTNVTFALEPKNLTCQGDCFTINWEPYTYNNSWYATIEKNDEFGEVIANGTCVRIVDWLLPDGGAAGRFGFLGNKIVAKRPDAITSQFLERTVYKMKVTAVDIFGLRASTDISITIPAMCEEQHKCICPNGYNCQCNFGYGGDLCDVCDSTRKNISINPNCTECADCPLPSPPLAATVTGPCLYPEGQCDVFCTRDITCNGHGTCNPDPAHAGECMCDKEWTGTACDQCAPNYYNISANCSVYCGPGTCNGHGTCNPNGLCDCTPPLGGPTCTQCAPPYFPPGSCDQVCNRAQNCSGNGECAFDVNGYPSTCNCDADYIGPWTVDGCNISCTRAECSGHGECNKVAGTSLGDCVCDKKDPNVPGSGTWTGTICDKCEDNWYPVGLCDTFCTAPLTCMSRGTCDSNGICVCDDPVHWTGSNCSVCVQNYYPAGSCTTYCESSTTCSSHGTCNAFGACVCDDGYQGLDCSVCKLDYYPIGNECIYCEGGATCSGHGSCDANATCVCDIDWFGLNCSTPCSRPLNCSDHGECNIDTRECDCDPNFVNEPGGSCTQCLPNWYPPRVCSIYCDPDVNCSGNGLCSWIDGSCVCGVGWEGDNCSTLIEYNPVAPPITNDTGKAPSESMGAASDDSSCPFEIGGVCLLWLIILLAVLLCCLLMLALYYLLKKKKEKKKAAPEAEPQADQALLGDWGGGDLNGMDPNAKNRDEEEPKLNEESPGVNFGEVNMVEAKEGDDCDFGPAGLDGMDPDSKSPGVNFGGPDAGRGGPDFGPADLGGMDPNRMGSGNGNDFGPVDLGGMNPLGMKGAPGNDFGPADLGGLAPLGGMKWDAGSLDGMEPLHRDAMNKGKVPAAARQLQPVVDSSGNRVSPPWKKNLDNKLNDFDQATGECREAVTAALASPNLSPDGRKALENVLDPGWGPADMSSMDPLARQAVVDGKTGAILADAMKTGALGAAANKLEGPLKNWEAAAAALAGAAGAAAGAASISRGDKDLLKSVDEGSPDKTSFSKLEEPTHVAAAALGAVPAAVDGVLKGGAVPPAAASKMKASFDALKKKDTALEKAMREAASNDKTPQNVKDELGSALMGNWGPADLNDMDPLKNAVQAGALAAVSREALRQPGIPINIRKKLEDALHNNDKARDEVVKAARAASNDASVPVKEQTKLKNALNDKDSIRALGDSPMVKEAEGRGRPVAVAEQLVRDPSTSQAVKDALKRSKEADAALLGAVAGMKGGDAKAFLESMLNNDDLWGPPDNMSDMEALAVKNGKTPVTVRKALKQCDMNPADKEKLERALATSDAAAADLQNAMKGLDFGAPDADAMSQMDPLQRACMARGKLPVAVNQVMANAEPKTQMNLQDKLREAARAEDELLRQVRANCEDPTLPEHARKLLEDAVNDTWGPADLSEMDPMARNAMSKGQVAAAVGAVLSQPDVPVNLRKRLQAAYDEANFKHSDLRAAAEEALRQGNVTAPGDAKKLRSALDLDFDGNVALDDMGPLRKAAQSGMVPVAVRNVLKGNPHAKLEATMKAVEMQETKFAAAVRDVVNKMDLPADAKKQLEEGLDGRVTFIYGAADMGGMNPMKGALEQAVRGVLKKGGLSDAAALTLEAAVTEMETKYGSLETVVRDTIKGNELPKSAKDELQDALYGKARLNEYNFTAADLDLNSDEFAPLGHAVAGGLPGLGPNFLGRPVNQPTLQPSSLGDASMARMLPAIKTTGLAPPPDDLLGSPSPRAPVDDNVLL
eukprot:TRINITY_DN5656_c0_g1_i6.p1 TRINITY_DN5656_c0_g1~~TRINITY_DN5656_c0_g1_i6.p1  ORF type:complete len:2167 (+),score=641.02 TRINITY_DN5656_c0_g1_i6:692-6502(+)